MNAILRTAELLDKIQKFSNPNEAMGRVYAEALHTVYESPDFYIAVGTLIDQFERDSERALELEDHERARAIYKRSIDNVRPWLHPYQARSQNASGVQMIANDIDQLFVIGSKLPSLEDVIEPALIEVAIAEAQNLQQTLSELNIDATTKLYLIRLIDTLLMALRSVDIIGVEGLSKVFGGFASELARVNANTLTPEAATWVSSTRKWVGKVGKGMLWTAAFVTAGSHAITDGADVINLIAGPDSEQKASDPH